MFKDPPTYMTEEVVYASKKWCINWEATLKCIAQLEEIAESEKVGKE